MSSTPKPPSLMERRRARVQKQELEALHEKDRGHLPPNHLIQQGLARGGCTEQLWKYVMMTHSEAATDPNFWFVVGLGDACMACLYHCKQ